MSHRVLSVSIISVLPVFQKGWPGPFCSIIGHLLWSPKSSFSYINPIEETGSKVKWSIPSYTVMWKLKFHANSIWLQDTAEAHHCPTSHTGSVSVLSHLQFPLNFGLSLCLTSLYSLSLCSLTSSLRPSKVTHAGFSYSASNLFHW